MTPSEKLRRKIRLVSQPLNAVGKRLWSHPELAEILPEFFFHAHCMMRASVPLMQIALSQAEASAGKDLVAAGLADYLAKHIPEELNHDEWLLDDLEVLGLSRSEALARIPPATVASTVGLQYYWIFHHHPVGLMGYIAVLEGNPPSAEHLEKVMARTGLPRDGFRCYLKHAQLDRHHREELYEMIDGLPLSPQQEALIGISACRTVGLMAQFTEEMLRLFEQKREQQ